MPRPSGRASRVAAIAAAVTVAVALVAAGCRGNDDGNAASPTPTPIATPTPPSESPTPTPTPTPDPNGDPAQPPLSHERQARDALLRLAFDLSEGTAAWPDVDAVAMRLEQLEGDPGQETWFAVSTGAGVTERLGARSHTAGILVRRTDGGWTEIALYTLQSTPLETDPRLVRVSAGGDLAWIGVFGSVADVATTFELLRFNGAEFSSALWWFSRGSDAARLIDLDGDGMEEIVLDGADRSVLCQGCDVVAHEEVIHRWSGDRLVLVELVPLNRSGELAALVDRAVAQARADLWRGAAETFAEAVDLDPSDQEVAWMSLLARRIADARLEHAGAAAQPFLTYVLAGEHAAAVDLMRPLDPGVAFDREGPVVAGTDAVHAPDRMAELLVDYANRAIQYDDGVHAAYIVRAFGLLLEHPDHIGEARADLQRAAELEPDDEFYAAALAYLVELDEAATAAAEAETDDELE